MKNIRFFFELVSLLSIMLFSCVAYATQPATGVKSVEAVSVQSPGVSAKPLQQKVNASDSSITPCASYCDTKTQTMIEQKLVGSACKQTGYPCFPYTCNYEGTSCYTSCTGNFQCAIPSAYCDQSLSKCTAGNNCPSKCEGDVRADYIPMSGPPKSDLCRKDKTTPCAPYGCNPQTGFCRSSCTSDVQCSAGSMCTDKNVCVPAYAHCDNVKANILILPDGSRVDCNPYKCKGGACLTHCSSVDDCVTERDQNGRPVPGRCFLCDSQQGSLCSAPCQ